MLSAHKILVRDMKGLTLERSPMYVRNVGKLLPDTVVVKNMKVHTLGRSSLYESIVVQLSTQKENHIVFVNNVEKHSVTVVIIRDIKKLRGN